MATKTSSGQGRSMGNDKLYNGGLEEPLLRSVYISQHKNRYINLPHHEPEFMRKHGVYKKLDEPVSKRNYSLLRDIRKNHPRNKIQLEDLKLEKRHKSQIHFAKTIRKKSEYLCKLEKRFARIRERKNIKSVLRTRKTNYAGIYNELFSKESKIKYSDIQLESLKDIDFSKLIDMKAIMPDVPTETIKVLTDLFSVLYQLYRSTNALDVAAAISRIATNDKYDLKLVQGIHRWFVNEIPGIQTEAKSDTLNDYFGVLRRFIDSDLLSKIKVLVVSMMGRHMFSKDTSRKLANYLGNKNVNVKAKVSVFELVEHLIETICAAMRIGEGVSQGLPVSDLILKDDPLTSAYIAIDKTLVFKDHLYSGLPCDGRMCRRTFISELEAHEKFLQAVEARMSPLDEKIVKVRSYLIKVVSIKNSEMNIIKSSFRDAPMGYIVHGVPGGGKSKIVPYIASVHAEVKGRIFNPNQIFTRNPSQTHWEGYLPNAHPYIHYSEMGNKKPERVEKMGDDSLEELTSIVDDMNYTCHMAFEEKGKIQANPELVLVDTNNKFLNFQEACINPAAYIRRFDFVGVSVKPEYQLDGESKSIDPTKSYAAGGNTLDRYIIHVTSYRAITATKMIPYKSKTFDIYEFTEFLRDEITERLRQNDEKHKVFGQTNLVTAASPEEWQSKQDESVSDKIELESYVRLKAREKWMYENAWSCCTEIYENFDQHKEDAQRGVRVTANFASALTQASLFSFISKAVTYDSQGFWSLFWYGLIGMIPLEWYFIAMFLIAFIYFSASPKKWKACNLAIFVLHRYLGFTISLLLLLRYVSLNAMPNQHSGYIKNYVIKHFSDKLWENEELARRRWLVFFNFEEYKVVEPTKSYYKTKALIAGLTSLGAAFVAYKCTLDITMESSNFISEGAVYSDLEKIEDETEATEPYQRIKIEGTNIWQTVDIQRSHRKTRNSFANISACISKNVMSCKVLNKKGDANITKMIGIKGDIALLNYHNFGDTFENSVMEIYPRGKSPLDETIKTIVNLSALNVVQIGPDVALVRCAGMKFRDITPYITPKKIEKCHAMEGRIGGHDTILQLTRDVESTTGVKMIFPICYKYQWPEHRKGVCGTPLIADVNGGKHIIGIHCAGEIKGTNSFSVPINMSTINVGIQKLYDVSPFLPVCSESLSMDTVMPGKKSCTRFEDLSGIRYMGSTGEPVTFAKKSKVTPTPYGPYVANLMGVRMRDGDGLLMGPPPMTSRVVKGKYINPYNVNVKALSIQKPSLNTRTCVKVINYITNRITSSIDKKLKPLTLKCAVNGHADDAYLRSMNVNTSSGYGWVGLKREHLPHTDGDDDKSREPSEELASRIKVILDGYAKLESVGIIYKGCLKDEARSRAKNAVGKTRMFYISPVEQVIICRMYLYPFYSMMVEKGHIFGSSVGINMFKPDAFVRRMTNFSELLFEGDYKWYDKSMPIDITQMANSIIYNVLRDSGYNYRALQIVTGILSDNLHILICVLTDIFEVMGIQPSGKYATAEDNSLKNLIMLVYAWMTLPATKDLDFFTFVRPETYGDDLLAAIKDEIKDIFNAEVYSKFCLEHYSMQFTAAIKDAEIKPYQSISESTYLKRTFRYDDVRKRWFAPLDKQSMVKSMYFYIPSNSVSREEQWISTASSFLYELYQHYGEDKFNKMRNQLIQNTSQHYKTSAENLADILPTYNRIDMALNDGNVGICLA